MLTVTAINTPSRVRSKEPWLGALASWAVLGASFGLSASTWIALAVLAGFKGEVLGVHLTWLMPICVDGYVVGALVLWMAPVPVKVASFAKYNTYAAALIGVAVQSLYHTFEVYSDTHQPWRAVLAAIVGALPPAVAALAVHMRALLRREIGKETEETPPIVAAVEAAAEDPYRPGTDAHLPADDLSAIGTGHGLPVPAVDLGEPAAGAPADLEPDGSKPRTRGPVFSTEARYEEARTAYRKSVEDGLPLTGKALGDRFGMSERWGRDRIAEVKQLAEIGKR